MSNSTAHEIATLYDQNLLLVPARRAMNRHPAGRAPVVE
jgi:hypothetical protein